MIWVLFSPMPVSCYRSTLTTALNDNENRNTLFKRRWLLSMPFSIYALPAWRGWVSVETIRSDSLRTQVHILAALTAFYSSAENKLNTRLFSGWVSFRWGLKTQRLSVATGDIGVLVLLSLVWVLEPGLAPDVTHLPLKRDVYLGLSSFRSRCFLASMMRPAVFTLSFPVH